MILAEFILLFLIGFSFFIGAVYIPLLINKLFANKKVLKENIKKAFVNNNKEELKYYLSCEDSLDEETKEAIRIKIDDITIEEHEEEQNSEFKRKLND